MFRALVTFQHDELKPLTKGFTDSLSELGNLNVLMYRQIYCFHLSRSLKIPWHNTIYLFLLVASTFTT
jgi:hypothetical protein